MPIPPAPVDLPLLTVHPSQLGIADFSSYALVLDTRAAARFEEDHLPGAISLPMPAQGAATVPDRLRELASGLPCDGAVLLYADGADVPWAEAEQWLRSQGLQVDVLGGGWQRYRRWVESSLEVLPRMLQIRVLKADAAEAVAKTSAVLAAKGEQVIDLDALSGGSQYALGTRLLQALRHVETDRRVWIVHRRGEAGSDWLPPAFAEAVRAAPTDALPDAIGRLGPDEVGQAIDKLLGSLDQSNP